MKRIRLSERSGGAAWAFIEKVGSTVWLHWNGQTYSFDGEKRRQSKASGGDEDPSQILAPMPGKILKVQASKGDKVTAGQTLVVMEAMKMEYSLKAQADAVISELKIKDNQQVKAQEVLVKLDVVQSIKKTDTNNES